MLVVEADPEHQVPLAHALRARGHRVVAASSESGASALVAQWPVDLVLISEELTGTSGIEVTRRLLSAHPQLRIVLMASEGSPGLRTAARSAGAFDCVARIHVNATLASWLADAPETGEWTHGLDDELAAQSAE